MAPSEKSIALGFQTLIARSLGTVPGPIVLGYVIDQTCLVWSNSDQEECVGKGSCKVYDNSHMSHSVLIMLLVWRILAALCFTGALHFAKKKQNLNGI